MNYEQNIYGSHNGSNTVDAVLKTSKLAIEKLINYIICMHLSIIMSVNNLFVIFKF